tara:strand:- start:93 stop:431 length:339 start_codon:yes stop_codon:yes gene_type:complete
MKIYHNPRCRKSREGVEYLSSKGIDFEIIYYLKNPLSKKEIKLLVSKLGISISDLIRKNEKIWKDNYKNQKLSINQIIEIIFNEPKLMERPIIESEKRAVIGRPKENIDNLL